MTRAGTTSAAAKPKRPQKRKPGRAAPRASASRTRKRRPNNRTARAVRARRRRIIVTSLITAASLLLLTGVVVLIGTAVRAFDDLGRGFGDLGSSIVTGPLTEQPVAAYDAEQLGNAATIMAAGSDLGLPLRDQAIAVMTAMGESSLRNIDYGDWETSGITNPDGSRTTSIGLFQQQDGWGTREQRLDPYTAATLFYRAMIKKVPDPERQQTQPTLVAHRTQINRDPQHYARYWPAAVGVIEQLSGEQLTDASTP